MNEQLLWDIICKNAEHIKTINSELAGVLVSLEWVKSIIMWQLWLGGGIFIAVIGNFFLIIRNGRRK